MQDVLNETMVDESYDAEDNLLRNGRGRDSRGSSIYDDRSDAASVWNDEEHKDLYKVGAQHFVRPQRLNSPNHRD